MFASALTFQLPKYCLRVQDPQAWAIDAMSFPWSGLRLYAFPPVQSAPSITSESSSGRSRPPSHSPSLASETLVSSPSVTTSGFSKEPSASPGPSSSAYLPLPSSSSGSSASFTLAAFRKRGQEAGLSERAADFATQSLRPSTRCSYDARLAGFLKWCSQSACDPYTASLGSIADFLVSLFDKNSSVSTIRGYRSAIASFPAGFPDGSTVSNSPFLTRLLKSFFLKRPPSRSLIPSWSLPSVLCSLTSSPFEPLHKASLFHLTLKTVFRLAVASGQRRSSLQALSIEPGHLRWENSGVRLIPKASFIAKNQTASSGSVEVFFPLLPPFPLFLRTGFGVRSEL